MPRDLVINELSIEDFDGTSEQALELVELLARLWTAIHPAHSKPAFQIWSELTKWSQEETHENRYFRRLIRALSRGDQDRTRYAKLLLQRAVTFEDTFDEEVLVKQAKERIARGLAHARRSEKLSVSLATPLWAVHSVPVTVRSLSATGGLGLQEQDSEVAHASCPLHVRQHATWMSLTDIEALRLLLATAPPQHERASEYSRGKHVQGQNNQERKNNARRPRGESQYLATLPSGAEVTDTMISQWESKALSRVRAGDNCVVEKRGESFWVYCDLGEPVGYIGGSEGDDEPTAWVRVELSSGTVHSHPRRPARELARAAGGGLLRDSC